MIAPTMPGKFSLACLLGWLLFFVVLLAVI